LSGIKVCDVAAGASCAVTAAGELYTWGSGGYGRLGHGDAADQLSPTLVNVILDECVVAVASAWHHTIVVTRGGSVFGWGRAEGLGLPKAATTEQDGECRISSCRYPPKLSCVPHS
jgi:alpha-tubulin suppressor-like RCC1 family protein